MAPKWWCPYCSNNIEHDPTPCWVRREISQSQKYLDERPVHAQIMYQMATEQYPHLFPELAPSEDPAKANPQIASLSEN
jgi:hypothetical protein